MLVVLLRVRAVELRQCQAHVDDVPVPLGVQLDVDVDVVDVHASAVVALRLHLIQLDEQ